MTSLDDLDARLSRIETKLDTALAGGPTPPQAGPRYPADVVDLRNWKLTLPVSKGGKVVEIRQPRLATYADRYFGLTDRTDGIRLRVWHGGDTTSGSPNPRSELREMTASGMDEFDWSMKKGTHSLEVVQQVNRLTKVKPHVVAAQIHGKDDDVTVWRVEGSKLWVTKGDDSNAYLVDGNFALGKRYTLRFDVAGGKVSFTYNGKKLPFTVASTDSACYFKTGNYLQSNSKSAPGESTEEYAEVVLFSAVVSHAA